MQTVLKRIVPNSVVETARFGKKNRGPREQWLQQALAQLSAGSRILDAGAGELRYKSFCDHLEYVSQDFAQYDGHGDAIGLQTGTWDQTRLDFVSDITAVPEADSAFDAVMCIEVLEHVPAPIDALQELTRLLRPGGTLIVTAPFCSMTHYAPYFFQTGYSRYFYEYWLEKFGFDIIDMQWNGNYFEYLAQELQRLGNMNDQYGQRRLTFVEKLARFILLRGLKRAGNQDQRSEQLLSFGLHVMARKSNPAGDGKA